jgi:hypothetical protein
MHTKLLNKQSGRVWDMWECFESHLRERCAVKASGQILKLVVRLHGN